MKQNQSRCSNCGIRSIIRKLLLITQLTDNHQKILAQWLNYHQQIPIDERKICAACLIKVESCENVDSPPRAVGHESVCTGCGKSILRKIHRKVTNEESLALLIPEYKQYQHFKTGQYFTCKACYTRIYNFEKISEKVSQANTDKEYKKNPEIDVSDMDYIKNKPTSKAQPLYNADVATFKDDFLILPGYKRAAVRKGKCLVPKCAASTPSLSQGKRRLLFLQTNTLVVSRMGLCKRHAQFNNSEQFGFNHFSKKAIEEAIRMCEKPVATIDFDCIHDMPDHVCKYWTGLTTEKFKALYQKLNVDTSQFCSLRNALAVHLLRQKTGDSILKLANLFLMSTSTLSRQLLIIEKSFETYNNNLKKKMLISTKSD